MMQKMTCLIVQNIVMFSIILFILLSIYALSLQVEGMAVEAGIISETNNISNSKRAVLGIWLM